MRLNLSLTIIGLLLFVSTNAQKTWEFTFEDGTTKEFTQIYDDPTLLPTYNLGLGIGVTVLGGGALTYQVLGDYRFTDRLMASAKYTRAVSENTDGGVSDVSLEPQYLNRTQDFKIMGHFKLFSGSKSKERDISIDFETDGFDRVIYKAPVPRRIKNSFDLDFGYNFMSIPKPIEFPIGIDSRIYSANATHHLLMAGFSYARDQAHKFVTDGVEYAYKRHTRVYLNFAYAISNNAEFYRKNFETPSGEPTIEELSKPDAIPDLKNFHWRIGCQTDLGINNTDFAMYFGVDMGSRPYYNDYVVEGNQDFELEQSDLILMIHFGVRFGK